jgi:hypothetical protein
VPFAGSFAMLEICISPWILMENRHVSPEATLKKPVESAPQLDNVPDAGHSEAACADGIDAELGAATTSNKTMTFDDDLMLPPICSKMRASMVVALIRIKATRALFWPSRDRSQLSPNLFRCYHSVTDFGR